MFRLQSGAQTKDQSWEFLKAPESVGKYLLGTY